MPRDITIDFNPATYGHNVYTGITSGTTTDMVCSNESVSCTFTINDTYIASHDTMWVRFTCDGCKDQYYEVNLIKLTCRPVCTLVGSSTYLDCECYTLTTVGVGGFSVFEFTDCYNEKQFVTLWSVDSATQVCSITNPIITNYEGCVGSVIDNVVCPTEELCVTLNETYCHEISVSPLFPGSSCNFTWVDEMAVVHHEKYYDSDGIITICAVLGSVTIDNSSGIVNPSIVRCPGGVDDCGSTTLNCIELSSDGPATGYTVFTYLDGSYNVQTITMTNDVQYICAIASSVTAVSWGYGTTGIHYDIGTPCTVDGDCFAP